MGSTSKTSGIDVVNELYAAFTKWAAFLFFLKKSFVKEGVHMWMLTLHVHEVRLYNASHHCACS